MTPHHNPLAAPSEHLAPTPGKERHGGLFVGTLTALILSLGVITVFSFPVNHDVAWFLYLSEQVLAGRRLYVDVVEINPPFIVFMGLPAAFVSQHVDIATTSIFRIFVLGLAGLSLASCWRTIRLMLPGGGGDVIRVLCAFVLLPLVGYDFAQREHIVIILALPYLLMAAARSHGVPVGAAGATLGAAAAALGIAFKPYFLPLWFFVEGYVWFTRPADRRLSLMVNGAVASVLLAHIAVLVFVTPEYFGVARMAATIYPGFVTTTWGGLIGNYGAFAAGVAIATTILIPRKEMPRGLRVVLSGGVIALSAAAVVQGKGWSYHWFPAQALALLLLGANLWERYGTVRPEPSVRARFDLVLPALVGLAALAGATNATLRDHEPNSFLLPFTRTIEETGDVRSIYAFTTIVSVGFPLVMTADVQWTSRFNHFWMLPGVVRGRLESDAPSNDIRDIERYMFDSVIDDIATNRPDLIFVDRRDPLVLDDAFDYIDYFSADHRFRTEMQNYAEHGSVGRFLILKRRRSPSL